MDINSLPLHICHIEKTRTIINRVNILIVSLQILFLLYYRLSSLFWSTETISIFPWLLITAAELFFSFYWLLAQAYRWRPVTRTVYLERLPCDEQLPAIDVFICTADPKKEPPVGVMNTVLSAMCLDYPHEKLSVYLSDDAGAPITLFALREAFEFARFWVPFCKRHGIKIRCPQAYFSESATDEESNGESNAKFVAEREEIKLKYKSFNQRLEKAATSDDKAYSSSPDRAPVVEVIGGNEYDELGKKQSPMPLLVYVSREKRQSYPHHFKAGALNVLFRISGIITNAPYVLVLDCDMYCNDPTSARQAMCFHLDPQISSSLAYVQFPQEFHNVTKNDIYNGQLKTCFKVMWPGMDGLKGPILSGTGFYLKRETLFQNFPLQDLNPLPSKRCFSPSNGFIDSQSANHKSNALYSEQEAMGLASCTYERDTQWGKQIGFMYQSVVEDYLTGFLLHCKGWNSIYQYSPRPAFLGSVTTNLNDAFVQTARWNSGLLQVCFSRHFPLIYGSSRMSVLQSMCYGYLALQPLSSLAFICYAVIPQICLLKDIPLYPQVSNPWFSVFATLYIYSLLQNLWEGLSIGRSFIMWWNEYRMSTMRTVTAYFVSCLDLIMKLIRGKEIKFSPTNKVVNEEQVERYNMDVFDFQTATIFLLPLTTIVNLNIASCVVGLRRVVIDTTYGKEMFGQIFLSFLLSLIGYPIIEGMIIRKDRGRIPISVTFLSVTLVAAIISFGFSSFA